MLPGTGDLGPEAYLHVEEVEETDAINELILFENLSSIQQERFEQAVNSEDKRRKVNLTNFYLAADAVEYSNSTYLTLISEEDTTIEHVKNISKGGVIAETPPKDN